jgi:hypothetical protein
LGSRISRSGTSILGRISTVEVSEPWIVSLTVLGIRIGRVMVIGLMVTS